MGTVIIFIQGLFELFGLGGFLIGYFADIWWLMVLGGGLVILDDITEIYMGILNPLFPVLLAIALSIVMSPWYVGIFWASAAFKVFGLPNSLKKVFIPRRLASEILTKQENDDIFG